MIAPATSASIATPSATATPQQCGFVEFIPVEQPRFDRSGQVYERIVVRVHYNDGTSATQPLDYDFTYPKKELDPFIDPKLPDPVFQFPPKELAAKEPPLIQLVVAHSDAQGHMKLCGSRKQSGATNAG